jgi:hypothetical protein
MLAELWGPCRPGMARQHDGPGALSDTLSFRVSERTGGGDDSFGIVRTINTATSSGRRSTRQSQRSLMIGVQHAARRRPDNVWALWGPPSSL